MKTLLAAATTLALLVAFAGCTSSGNDAPGARQGVGSTAPNDEQDDDGGGDSQRCLEAFNDLSARCGAQFVDSDGAVIPLNDLLEACGEPAVECIVSCGVPDGDCDDIRACLSDRCDLTG